GNFAGMYYRAKHSSGGRDGIDGEVGFGHPNDSAQGLDRWQNRAQNSSGNEFIA
ncbi:MAG: hypothetical protein ICV72_01425, partial [Aldersonia sp.]|nr:hypothetical protein [Aldersonia sp.]